MAGANLRQIAGSSFLYPWGISIVAVESAHLKVCDRSASFPHYMRMSCTPETDSCKNLGNLTEHLGREKISHLWLKPEILAMPRAHISCEHMHYSCNQSMHSSSPLSWGFLQIQQMAWVLPRFNHEVRGQYVILQSGTYSSVRATAINGCFSHLGSCSFHSHLDSHIPLPVL